MKKITVFLLIGALLILLCGCGSDKAIIGTWETQMDLSDVVNQGVTDEEDLAPYVQVEGFSVPILFTFREDGTYSIRVNAQGLEDACDALTITYSNGMRAYLTDLLAAGNLDETVDELLESNGNTIEELVESVLDMQSLRDAILSVETEGNYKAAEGKLFTTQDTSVKVDKEVYETYEITEDGTLKLMGSGDGQSSGFSYPIIMTKKV